MTFKDCLTFKDCQEELPPWVRFSALVLSALSVSFLRNPPKTLSLHPRPASTPSYPAYSGLRVRKEIIDRLYLLLQTRFCTALVRSHSLHKMNPDDDDRSSSTPTAASKSVSGQDKDKPRLTDQEKKNNHIASEQKRRAAIREGFDRLTELVPGLEGQGRSESIVLQKTVEFMHLKLQERQNLIAEVENKGGRVDDSLRPT